MAWYNASWGYRVKITVLATKVDADLVNYPVYVDLNDLPAGFHTNCNQTDARDIRVTKSDGTTEVAREVVFYTAASDIGELHFLADAVDSDTDTDFYIYYGNAAASDYAHGDPYGTHAVWVNCAGVWHLQGSYGDSSPNSYDLTGSGTPASTTSGSIYGAYDFEASETDYIYHSTPTNLRITGDQTWSGWHKPENNATTSRITYVCTASVTQFAGIGIDGGTQRAAISVSDISNVVALGPGTCTAGNWYQVVGVYDATNTQLQCYVNGSIGEDLNSTGTHTKGTTSVFAIGKLGAYAQYADGIIDEVRVRSSALTGTWISTEYNNQSSPGTFYTVGAEETNATTAIKDIIGGGYILFPR